MQKRKIKLSFKTVISRVLFFNILLVLLVTIIPQLFFYNYFNLTYNKEINNYNTQIVKQVQKSVDELVLERVVSIPGMYFSDVQSNIDLIYPLNFDISSDSVRTLNVTRKLAYIKNTLNFIDSIDVYYKKSNLLFLGTTVEFLNSRNFSDKGNNVEWFNRLITTDFKTVWLNAAYNYQDVTRGNAVYVTAVPFNVPREERQAIIAIGVKRKALDNVISNIEYDGRLLIMDGEGTIISQDDNHQPGEDFVDDGYIRQILKSGDDGVLEARIDQKAYIVSFAKSHYNNWRYVSLASIDNIYQRAYQLRNYLAIICISLLILSIAVSIVLTKSAHKPLRNIIKNIGKLSNTLGSGEGADIRNEYQLLDSTLRNAASKVDELNQKLEINKPIIRHNAILKLLNGNPASWDGREWKDELLDVQLTDEFFFCFVIKVFRSHSMSFQNEMLINYSIVEALENNIPDITVKAIINDDCMIAGIVNYSASIGIEKAVASICSTVEELLQIKYVIATGKEYSLNEEEISTSYHEACESLKYAFIKTDIRVLKYDDLNPNTLKETGSSRKILDRVEDALRTADEQKLLFALEGLVESIRVGSYNVEYCRNTLMDMVTLVRITLESMSYETEGMFGYDLREYYKTVETLDEFKQWMTEVIRIALKRLNEKRQSPARDMEGNVKKFIEENLMNDLSLDSVAAGLHLNPVYLSRIFKNITGMNFSDYVTEIKLKKAAQLLQENKLTVKEISQKLGYSSTQYFIRIFKGRYGLTPKEYQKNNIG